MFNPDVVILTETWSNESVSNEYLSINGYEIIERMDRNDTDKGRGGGIVVYVMKDLCAWKIACNSEFNQCGMVGIKLNNRDLKILAVYRSPNSTKTNDDELCKLIESMNGSYVIIGDFNFPDIRWESGCSGSKGRKFYETVNDKFLVQHVNKATHNSGNVLDLILSDNEDTVRDVEMIGKIGKSDHEMITCEIDVDVIRSRTKSTQLNFYKANGPEMCKVMRKDWRRELEGKSVN